MYNVNTLLQNVEEKLSKRDMKKITTRLSDYDFEDMYFMDIVSEMADFEIPTYNGELFETSWEVYINGYTEQALYEYRPSDLPELLIHANYLMYRDIIWDNFTTFLEELVIQILIDKGYKEISKNNMDILWELIELEEYDSPKELINAMEEILE